MQSSIESQRIWAKDSAGARFEVCAEREILPAILGSPRGPWAYWLREGRLRLFRVSDELLVGSTVAGETRLKIEMPDQADE